MRSKPKDHEWAHQALREQLPDEDVQSLNVLEESVDEQGNPKAVIFCKSGGAFEKQVLFRVSAPAAPGEAPQVERLTLMPEGGGIMEA